MTKRTRISKAAQRRRRREWQSQALYSVAWSQIRSNVRIAAGIDWAISGGDKLAIVPYAVLPDGTWYVPYETIATPVREAIQTIDNSDMLYPCSVAAIQEVVDAITHKKET